MKATHNALLNKLELALRNIERVSAVQRARLFTDAAETLRSYEEELPAEARARYAQPGRDVAGAWLGMARSIVTRSNHDVVEAMGEAVETLRVSRYLVDRQRAAGASRGA